MIVCEWVYYGQMAKEEVMDRMRGFVVLFFVAMVAAMFVPVAGCAVHTRAPWAPKEVAKAPLGITVVYNERITVDYRKKIGKLVEEGQYDSIGSNITAKNFPRGADGPRGVIELDVVLVDTDRAAMVDEILDAMEQHGLRPGTLQELLTLGAENPDLQRDDLIVALGSVSVPQLDGTRHVAWILGNATSRNVSAGSVERRWNELRLAIDKKAYFLAVADGGE